MKFLIAGYGSIGKRHCDNLKKIVDNSYISFFRELSKEEVPGFQTYFNLEEALSTKPDAAIITNPTSMHVPLALKCAEAGTNLFIEKPLSNSFDGVEELVKLKEKNNLTAMIGCNMRFHPSIEKLKELVENNTVGDVITAISHVGQYLPDWHPNTDYTESYSAKEELGGGVILDLIHELDYLYWLFGNVKNVFAFADKSGCLQINAEDNADILLKFKNGVKANVHLDYIQRTPKRNCQIIGEKGTIFWDYFSNSVTLYEPGKDVQTFNYNFERNDMYTAEMEHFITCIKNKKEPLINLEQGIDVLKIASAAKKSSREGGVINL